MTNAKIANCNRQGVAPVRDVSGSDTEQRMREVTDFLKAMVGIGPGANDAGAQARFKQNLEHLGADGVAKVLERNPELAAKLGRPLMGHSR